MKTKMKIAALSIVMVTITFSVQAQPGPHDGGKHRHGFRQGPDSCRIQLMVSDMAAKLELSSKQEKQLLEIHYGHMEEVKNIRKEYKNDCVEARDQKQASFKKLQADIEKVLGEELAGDYKELMADRRKPHGPKHKKKERVN